MTCLAPDCARSPNAAQAQSQAVRHTVRRAPEYTLEPPDTQREGCTQTLAVGVLPEQAYRPGKLLQT